MASSLRDALAALVLALLTGPALAAACQDSGPDLVGGPNTANTTRSANLSRVLGFIDRGAYLGWQHDPYIRPTGEIFVKPDGGIIDGSTHHRVRIYYSPRVAEWVLAGRPTRDAWVKKGKKAECYLPDGAAIVKEMYKTSPPVYPEEDPVIGWAVMVRKNGVSQDGWHWTIYFRPEFRSMETMGTFSYSFCYTCHASAKSEATFASDRNLTGVNAAAIDGRSYVSNAQPNFFTNLPSAPPRVVAPRADINPIFKKLYDDAAIYPRATGVPSYEPNASGAALPNTDFDHVWRRGKADATYLTSDNCIGCHDATGLVDTQVPNMLIRREVKDKATGKSQNELLNLSVYGEWRASPMGMAGRDPFFFAQLESEMNTFPAQAAEIENLCLSCHGAMGQRQYVSDKGRGAKLRLDTVFKTEGPDAHYAALARDGVSCMVCHQRDPATVSAADNTGKFTRGPPAIIYGSSSPQSQPGGPIRTWPMQHALGLTPTYDPYVNKAESCAVCHAVVLPVYSPGSGTVLGKAHEQDTFLEWFHSIYQNSNPAFPVATDQAKTCQDCHMDATFQGNGKRVNFKVANVQDTAWPIPPAENLAPAREITVPPRPEAGRHTLFGMNLFVLTLYDQFRSLFGILPDTNPPGGTTDSFKFALDDGEWRVANVTADVKILDVRRDANFVTARVKITNKAGHRLPSGVGMRRAWIEFSVVDRQDNILWASGRADGNGVLMRPDGSPLASEFTDDYRQLQPHWDVITSQEQVQVYEERYVYKAGTGPGTLNTSFLGVNEVVKDNRLLPRGYQYKYLLEKANAIPGDDEFESLLPTSLLPKAEGSINPRDDPDYTSGSGADTVTYRIPVAQLAGAVAVRAQLNYQSLPPYWLRERFASGKLAGGTSQQTQRLYYLTGHVNLEQSKIPGWKLKVQEDRAQIP